MSENVIGPSDTDTLAAEYVLGTLDFDERSAAQSLRAEDAEFAAKVKVWERRLGELHLMVEPVEPEPEIWQRIRAKLPEVQPDTVIALPEFKSELEPELKLMPEPELKPAGRNPEPQSKPEPAIIAAKSVPAASDASPAAPDAPTLPPWQPPLVQAQVAMPIAAPSSMSTTAADAPGLPGAVAPPAPPMVERDEKLRVANRHLAVWRTAAVLMTVAVLAVVALLSLWKYLPERVPPVLRPLELMRLVGITIDTSSRQRVPAPPESQFNE